MPENPKKTRAYAFIDSQNLNLGTQKMGWKMDWRKFLQYLQDEYNVEKAYLFIGYVPENVAMYEQLHELGYFIVLKRTLEINSPETKKNNGIARLDGVQGAGEERSKTYGKYGEGVLQPATQQSAKSAGGVTGAANEQAGAARKSVVKGNVDAELVLYAMKEMPNYDKAVIVSGDGDFHALVEYLDQQQKLLHLMVPNWQYSTLLKDFEKYVVRIDKLRRQLSYRTFKKRPRSSER